MDQYALALGRLEGKVNSILSGQKTAFEMDRESHRVMNEKIETVIEKLQNAEKRIESHDEDLKEIKPFMENAKNWHQRSVGALSVVGLLSGAAGGAVYYMKDKVLQWLQS